MSSEASATTAATGASRGSVGLVVENDPSDDVRRLGGWLTGAGLELAIVRPYAGESVPQSLDRYAALVVLGGEQDAFPGPDGTPGAPWFPELEHLLRKAVRYRVPTLAICLGAQLLATAHGGVVRRSPAGPEIGARLVARRDIAERDPLFAQVPFAPDVLQWHHDEVSELPAGAVLLAASTYYPHQAYRLGPAAWGVQFHIECDTPMLADWVSASGPVLAGLGYQADALIQEFDAVMDDVEEVWRPFAERFAALARGELPLASQARLPLLGG